MLVEQLTWSIKELVAAEEKVNLNPMWQRGAAWATPRQVLLIDSILRGMDIPKFYLRRLVGNPYEHDAVDGQQRIRAIWLFRSGELELIHPDKLLPIDGIELDGKKFAQLPKKLRDRFDSFALSIGEITSSTNDEITNLFSRLQMGVSLNPAELRNAILKPLRHAIDAMALTHLFFDECKIAEARYRRQDFVCHLFAVAAYQGTRDIKAPNLKAMILEFGGDQGARVAAFTKIVYDALTVLGQINELMSYRISQKWLFVDIGWMIMQLQKGGRDIDVEELAEKIKEFEALRKKYSRHPEKLIDNEVANEKLLNRRLYEYIVAFRAQGGTHANLKIRNVSLLAYCR